jgi:hypothetical protein
MHYQQYNQVSYPRRRRYGLLNFAFDFFMVGMTGGLWLIWIFCREMRNR